MYGKVIVVGRVGRQPNLEHTPTNQPVCNLSIAVDCGYGDKKETVWWQGTCWGQLAEFVAENVDKGALILLEGTPKPPHVYTGANGEPKAVMQMNVATMKFLEKRQPQTTDEPGDYDF